MGRRRFPGQLAYAAPERLLELGEADFRNDIFSFRVVLYHLLTGYLPFSASSLEEKKATFDAEKPSHVCSRNATVPEEIGDTVMAMIAANPAERPVNLMEIYVNLLPAPIWDDESGSFLC
ncbi:MAG: protein kinase domain-containing protein [Methylococcales bacterium]